MPLGPKPLPSPTLSEEEYKNALALDQENADKIVREAQDVNTRENPKADRPAIVSPSSQEGREALSQASQKIKTN